METLEIVKQQIQPMLESSTISGRMLLDRLRVIDESSRRTAAYADHRYAPFYYHLGKVLTPTTMLEVGFSLALLGSCFLKSCKTVTQYLGFQEDDGKYFSSRLGLANIRTNYKNQTDIYVGIMLDDEFTQKLSPNSWDLVILNEEVSFDRHLMRMDLLWPYISENGIMVAEYIERHTPSKEAFEAFCKSQNRVPAIFKTRYGTGLVQK